MNTFLDTSGIFALLVRTDERHAEALRAWQDIERQSDSLYTTNYVILETCALLHHQVGKHAVTAFYRDFLPATTIIWVNEESHAQALAGFLDAGRQGPSLVDYMSFRSIRSTPCQSVLAFDRHFMDQGIPLRQDLPKQKE